MIQFIRRLIKYFYFLVDEISSEGKSVKCPTFTPDGNTLVWLQRDVGGPHHSCMTLVKKDLPLKANKKVQT